MALKRVAKTKKAYETPLDLFTDLRPRRIAAPYDHQAQLLRDYADKGVDAADVAIQGATGSGKTLVGLLIAEWRRRQKKERPIYLCPTRQLVHQITAFATDKMGLEAYAFVGSKHDFPPNKKSEWQTGNSIAVATYSALFNVSPFFQKPNFIVVDDAHAADQYIGEYWTVHVWKHEEANRPIFDELASILGEMLPGDEAERLKESPTGLSDHQWVQIVPAPLVWDQERTISSVLDQAPNGSDLAYRWSVLKGQLHACQIYVSPYEIMIRPVLPPTGAHPPFYGAAQRLYMSATLGRGGELERLSGRKNIQRIPAPPGWDGHGVGRRFFLFPHASLDEAESNRLLVGLMDEAGKSLFMTPDDRRASEVRELIEDKLPSHGIFSAKEIEESKEPFVGREKAVALIANRYDGIDFPDDECRLLIVEGRPSGTGLQERFFADKLGANALYAERVRTRIVQAFGRCTRSANDYTLVLALGHKLLDELLLRENLEVMDVEFQAELQFGQQQSQNTHLSEFLEIAKIFYTQGDEWREAEGDIADLKDELVEETPVGLDRLEAAAKFEIEYMEKLWNGDFSSALDAAQSAVSALEGGKELRGYRAIWQYLAGCAAELDARERGASTDLADEHFRLAKSLGTVRWLGKLIETSSDSGPKVTPPEDTAMVERLEANLCELGLTNEGPFTRQVTSIRKGLLEDDAKRFERAHEALGNLLGFKANNSEEDGAPDPWWIAGDSLCFVFEDHSEGKEDNKLSIKKARQAASHPAWIKKNVPALKNDAEIIPVLITAADTSDEKCLTYLQEVAIWRLSDFRRWEREVLKCLRTLRSRLTRPGDLAWRAEALKDLSKVNATPSTLAEQLQALLPK